MKRSIVLRVSALTALGVASSVATSVVMSRANRAHAAQFPGPAEAGGITVYSDAATLPAPTPGEVRRPSKASGSMGHLKVDLAGTKLHYKASASMRDSRPDLSVVWALRVLDGEDKSTVRYEKLYDDKVFQLPPGEMLETTVEDELTLPLKPGSYLLELTWFRFDTTAGLASLNDETIRNRFQGAKARKKIVIKP